MKYYVDLHIHTALSPCGDELMTPNNIINMSLLKGLDFIAITDHNTTGNVKSVIECAKGKDIIVVPGIEAETAEEVHVVCLFKDIESAEKMGKIVYDNLPDIKNKPEIFGEQLLFDSEDNIIGYEKKMLLTATKLSIEEVKKKAEQLGGVVIPAHIDRSSNSIISNLGFVPEELGFCTLGLSRKVDKNRFLIENSYLKKYNFIVNSDAHYLKDILEKNSYVNLKEKCIDQLFISFKNR